MQSLRNRAIFGERTLQTTNPPLLDKQRIADSFKASGPTYEEHALVQKEISRQLIDLLPDAVPINPGRVLEIGCCTGILTELLVAKRSIGTLYVNDLVQDFCTATARRIAGRVGRIECLAGDIETCLLPGKLSLVLSSATLQWIADLPVLLGKIHAALDDGGHLLFSILGPGTMAEVSALTGRSLHYHTRDELLAMLAGSFRVTALQSTTRRLFFPTVRAVLQHIRRTGVGGIGQGGWLPGKYKDFARQYQSRFATELGVPVTYASIFIVAVKK
jgi:malonyl-CoA O-methyltransferase